MATSTKIIPPPPEPQDELELSVEVFRTRTDIVAPPPVAKAKAPAPVVPHPDLQHLLQDLGAGVEKFSLLDRHISKTHDDLVGLTRELRLLTERNLEDRAKNGKITGASLLLLEELKKLGDRSWEERHETTKALEESRAEVAQLSGVVAKASSDFREALVELKLVNDSAVAEVRERKRVFEDVSSQLPQARAELATLVQQVELHQRENRRLTESTTLLRQEEAVLRQRQLALQETTNRAEIAALRSREEEGRAAELAEQATIRSREAEAHLRRLDGTLQELSLSCEQLTAQLEQGRRELSAQRAGLGELEQLHEAQKLELEELDSRLKQRRHHLSLLEEEKAVNEQRHANVLESLRLEQIRRTHEAQEQLERSLALKQEHITAEVRSILLDIIDDNSLSSRGQKCEQLQRRLSGLLAPTTPARDTASPRAWLLGAAMSASLALVWLGSLF